MVEDTTSDLLSGYERREQGTATIGLNRREDYIC